MKKMILNIIPALILAAAMLLPAEALANDIKILVDGQELVTDAAPEIINDRTVIPMRAVFESLGARVEWFEEDKLIFAMKDDILITLKIGSDKMMTQSAVTNEKKVIALDVAPFIKDSRTIIPVRAVAEALNARVDWISEASTVTISSIQNLPEESIN